MPIYEYGCTVCGRAIDVVHGIHAEGPTVCESCGGVMKKLLSAPAIHFKGSGWAKKDARSAAAPAAAGAKKESAPAAEGTSESAPAASPASDAPAPAATPATPAATSSTSGSSTGSSTSGG